MKFAISSSRLLSFTKASYQIYLAKFQNCQLVLGTDNATDIELDLSVLKNEVVFRISYPFNKIMQSHRYLWRYPLQTAFSSTPCLAVIYFGKENSIQHYAEQFFRNDIFVGFNKFFIYEGETVPIFREKSLLQRFSGSIILMRNSRNASEINSFDVYNICGFCSHGTSEMTKITQWPNQNNSETWNHWFPDEFIRDFEGTELRGLTMEFYPYIIFSNKSTPTSVVFADCIDKRINTVLGSKYNFTIKFTEPYAGQWSQIVEELALFKKDVSCTLMTSHEREMIVDFTIGVVTDQMTFAFEAPQELEKWSSIIKPFQSDVWVIACLTFLIASAIHWLFRKILIRQQRHRLADDMMQFYRALTSQNPKWSSHMSIRTLAIFWVFFCLMLNLFYLGYLTAFMTRPALEEPPQTLHELWNSDYSYSLLDTGAIDFELFQNSLVYVHRKIAKNTKLCQSHSKCLAECLEGKHAYINWKSRLKSEITNSFTDRKGKQKIHLAKEEFFNGYVGLALQNGSPLKKPFDIVIRRLLEGGIIQQWWKEITQKLATKSRRNNKDWEQRTEKSKSLTISHFRGLFLVYIIGIIASFVAFLVEIIDKKH